MRPTQTGELKIQVLTHGGQTDGRLCGTDTRPGVIMTAVCRLFTRHMITGGEREVREKRREGGRHGIPDSGGETYRYSTVSRYFVWRYCNRYKDAKYRYFINIKNIYYFFYLFFYKEVALFISIPVIVQ